MNKFFLIVALAMAMTTSGYAQEKKELTDTSIHKIDTLPYLRFPTLPAFNILLIDSTTIFNTYNIPDGRPILIIFFDPECGHCKEETKRLLAGMDSLKDIRFYFISSVHSFQKLRTFYDTYHLSDYKNIEAVGRDYEYFFITYYGVKFVPDLVLYNGKKDLVKFFDRHVTVRELYDLTH